MTNLLCQLIERCGMHAAKVGSMPLGKLIPHGKLGLNSVAAVAGEEAADAADTNNRWLRLGLPGLASSTPDLGPPALERER